jgi:hypothetical protein
MKTIAKVLESMLSKPATPSWTTQGPVVRNQIGPDSIWKWEPSVPEV